MQVNIKKLKGKMAEEGENMTSLSSKCGMSRHTLMRKMRAGGWGFTVKDISLIAEALHLEEEEIIEIFLSRED